MNKNSIYGAIIGDIAGSHLEVAEIIAKQNKAAPCQSADQEIEQEFKRKAQRAKPFDAVTQNGRNVCKRASHTPKKEGIKEQTRL